MTKEHVLLKVIKGQVLFDFLVAHPVTDDSPLAIYLSNEEVTIRASRNDMRYI